MSQKGDIVILAPGETGWEAWTGPPAGPFELAEDERGGSGGGNRHACRRATW